MPEQIVVKIKEMHKNQIFIINDGENSLINFIADVRESPVAVEAAMPQIEQYLFNKKTKQAADAEIVRLRSLAKIDYLNASAPVVP
jgi:hypothetical protein